jgi:hypothetical protein
MTSVWRESSRTGLMLAMLSGLLLIATVGCGGGEATGTVKGTVYLGEEPFGDASVVLVSPDTGQGGSADVNPDGTFSIELPIPVGTYTAYLTPKIDEAAMMEKMQQGMATGMEMPKDFPAKYQNEASSDLKVQVEEGENEVTLRMETR